MSIKTIAKKYKERYSISYLDLADAGETNRIHALVFCPIIFFFGFLDIIVLLVLHYKNIRESLVSIIYFAIFTFLGFFGFLYSRWSKKVPREKSYILKTIPCYMIVYIAMFTAIYNFYILKQPYNGMVAYFFTGFISFYIFTLSPIWFFLCVLVGMIFLGPGVYLEFGTAALVDSFLTPFLILSISLYIRRTQKKQIMFLKKQKQSLEAKTFGNFTLIYEGKTVKFSRSKSEELIAYLIYKRGSSVKTKELISVLWGDHADSARYGSSLRNLIVDVKHTFAELEVQNFFVSEYNNFRINPEIIKCDYYDFLEGDKIAIRSFVGEFMHQYSWAEEVAGMLEMKSLK